MDPLSVMASVVGLLAAAGQVASILSNVRSSIKEAPRSIDRILPQVNELQSCFSAIHNLLIGIETAPTRRISMIQVDHLRATLTEAVLTFSELEELLTPRVPGSDISMLERIKWAWNEDTVSSIVGRLERHKSSLSLMLNIVQSSDLDANQSLQGLERLMEQLVSDNWEIRRRLWSLEDRLESQSILTTCFRNGKNVKVLEGEEHNSDVVAGPSQPRQSYDASSGYRLPFEVDLNTSRVYKRTQLYESDASFTSSAVRTHAWSVFSGLSLSQVSAISAIALPVYSYDVFNTEWYGFVFFEDHVIPRGLGKSVQSIPTAEGTGDTLTLNSSPKPSLSTLSPVIHKGREMSKIQSISISAASTSKPPNPLYKLVVLGGDNVGKVELTRRLNLQQHFEYNDANTIGSFRREAVIDGLGCTLEVLDTTGYEGYTSLRDLYLREGDGFVLVYSITSRRSFTLVSKSFNQVSRIKEVEKQPLAILLVGNNSDRVTEREVATLEGHALARELRCGFVEASAKNDINVEKAFYDVIRQIRAEQVQRQEEARRVRREVEMRAGSINYRRHDKILLF
ncbi:hypothetical protein G7Y89_g3974 [Cudoniella acicularis]|uniref:Uncharacterized protein n=1 Tax=Cudoniella acicularis TaxID=354080 RepID=A0A8H4W751_9HELO|nr:hypothetical protein G7Y89_g3974 [Cudoniella acicularis]